MSNSTIKIRLVELPQKVFVVHIKKNIKFLLSGILGSLVGSGVELEKTLPRLPYSRLKSDPGRGSLLLYTSHKNFCNKSIIIIK